MDKILEAYSKSCLTRTLLSFALFALIGGVFACLWIFSMALPRELVGDAGPIIFGVLFLGFFALLMAGVIVWVLSTNRKVMSRLDAAFTPFGLTPSRYLLRGRQYRGSYRGRDVNVYYYISGGRYLRTPVLQIYLGGRFRTRLGIGSENVLTRAGGALTRQEPITLQEPEYEGLLVYPLDETWSRALLSNPMVRQSIEHIVGEETPGNRGLNITPESIGFTVRHFSIDVITPNAVRDWIKALFEVADAAEQQMPPTITAEASNLERSSQKNRRAYMPIAIAIVASFIVCPLLFALGIIGLLALSGGF